MSGIFTSFSALERPNATHQPMSAAGEREHAAFRQKVDHDAQARGAQSFAQARSRAFARKP